MILVEDAPGVFQVEVIHRLARPRQRRDPVEVRSDHTVLGGRLRQALEAGELTVGRPPRLLGQIALVEAQAEIRELGLLRVAFSELVLDRLELGTQEVLALALVDLQGDLRLDSRSELRDLELALEDLRDAPEPLLDVDLFEQLLALFGLQPQLRGYEMAERAGIAHVRDRELEVLRQVRRHADDPRELGLDIPRQRLDRRRVRNDVGQVGEGRDQVRLVLSGLTEGDPARPLDEDPQRPVGNADHLVDDRGRANRVEIGEAGGVDVVPHREQRQLTLAGHNVVDQFDRALLADRERRHRIREDDRLLERQHREEVRRFGVEPGLRLRFGHRFLRTTISTCSCRTGRCESGSRTVSIPCS